jgi:hypothetical protein
MHLDQTTPVFSLSAESCIPPATVYRIHSRRLQLCTPYPPDLHLRADLRYAWPVSVPGDNDPFTMYIATDARLRKKPS